MLHYFLYAYGKDFQKLFMVKVDFTTRMPRDAESKRAYGLFVNTTACWEKLPPFDASVVARVVEYGLRSVEEQDQLSTGFGYIGNLIREAAQPQPVS